MWAEALGEDVGKIPARAGTTEQARHPTRACGEDPRAGGDDFMLAGHDGALVGRSPRGRGRRTSRRTTTSTPGKIPARAGTTKTKTRNDRLPVEDPRAGGDDCRPPHPPPPEEGRSPRGRGRRRRRDAASRLSGKIPARAGTTREQAGYRYANGEDPRAGGDDAASRATARAAYGRSPRGRGRRISFTMKQTLIRKIPARAGTTRSAVPAPTWRWEDPRAGGDDSASRRAT